MEESFNCSIALLIAAETGHVRLESNRQQRVALKEDNQCFDDRIFKATQEN